MPLDDLPYLDEHVVPVAAPPEDVWDAAVAVFGSFGGGGGSAKAGARLLGCDPPAASGPWPRPGSTVPGFRVVLAERPWLLVIAGRHRFSRYGIVLRVDPAPPGARCRLESRGTFPGAHGTAYRAAVVGTRFHVLAVRRLLGRIRQGAEGR